MKYRQLEFRSLAEESGCPIAVLDKSHTRPVSMHSHDFFELVYVKTGYTVHYYGDSTTILTEGDMFIISPGTPHAYTGLHETSVCNVIFLPEALADSKADFAGLPGMGWLTGGETDSWRRIRLDTQERIKVISLIEKMKDEQEQQPLGWKQMLATYLKQLVILFARFYSIHYMAETAEKPYLNYVVKILSYIEDNYAKEIDLNSIAAHIKISPDYLSRQFKKVIGLSPAVFLRSYRLARAMEMIRLDTNASLSDISTAVGYKHLSHFSREFKSFTSVTPSEFRNNYHEM